MFIDPLSRNIFDGAGSQGPIALMYHSVVPGSDIPDNPWAVSYERFCRQLDFLSRNKWQTVRVKDLSDLDNHAKKTAVITFDDGYEDNYMAFKALVERGMSATWFIVTNNIGDYPAWVSPENRKQPLLSQEMLREISNAGMEVASHSCSHSHMTQLDDAKLSHEVMLSKQALEDILDEKVVSFAYPYGDHDDRCIEAVKMAGYKYACTTRTGWALAGDDLFTLRRLTVLSDDSLSCFARKLAFATNEVGPGAIIRYYRSRLVQRVSGQG